MGIKLKNPIIMGANAFSKNLDYVKQQEKNGIAAVVYKTIFEKDIKLENLEISENLEEYEDINAEMINLLPKSDDYGPEFHLLNLKQFNEGEAYMLTNEGENWVSICLLLLFLQG